MYTLVKKLVPYQTEIKTIDKIESSFCMITFYCTCSKYGDYSFYTSKMETAECIMEYITECIVKGKTTFIMSFKKDENDKTIYTINGKTFDELVKKYKSKIIC